MLKQTLCVAFALVGLGAQLAADECSAILQHGIFDLSQTQTDETFFTQYLDYLNTQSFKTVNEAQGSSQGYGVTIPPIAGLPAFGLTANNNNTHSTQSEWANYYSQVQDGSTDVGKQFRNSVRSANPQIIEAWKDCAVSKKGTFLWAEWVGNGSDMFYLSARFVGDSEVGDIKYPTVFQLEHDHATCTHENTLIGRQLNGTTGGSKVVCTAEHGIPIPISISVKMDNGLIAKWEDMLHHNASLPAASFSLLPQPTPVVIPPPPPPATSWLDRSTQLTWQVADAGRTMTAVEAAKYCATGGLPPHDGRTWELPSMDELDSLDSRIPGASKNATAKYNTTGPIKLFGTGGEYSRTAVTDNRPNQLCDGHSTDGSNTNDGRPVNIKHGLHYFGDYSSDGTFHSASCDEYHLASALCILK